MRTLNINVDYKTKEVEGQKRLSNSELTLNYINYAVDVKYKEGLNGQIRRMYGRIQRTLEEAVETGKSKVELEESEFEFIKDAIKDAKFPTGLARFVSALEDELDKVNEKTSTK